LAECSLHFIHVEWFSRFSILGRSRSAIAPFRHVSLNYDAREGTTRFVSSKPQSGGRQRRRYGKLPEVHFAPNRQLTMKGSL
jgi:hypothetical protein